MANLDEIAQSLADKQNELKQALATQNTVDLEILVIDRQILHLRIKRNEFKEAQSKASVNVRSIQVEIKQLTAQYWDKKNI